MREVFGVPQIIEEAREVTFARTKPGGKPGILWVLTLLIGILLMFLSEFVAAVPLTAYLIFRMFTERIGDVESLVTGDGVMIVSLYSLVLVTVVFCLYVRIFEQRKLRTLGFVKKGAVLQYLIGIAAGCGIFSLAVLICYITGAVRIEINESVDYGMIALYTGGWLIQGMEEEVMCRGFLLTSMSRRYPVPAGVIVNSIAFAALHLLNPGIGVLPFINLTLYGIFSSLLFVKTGNIWMCSAVHSVWNLVQGNLYGISVSGNQAMPSILRTTFVSGKELFNGGAFGLEGGLGVTAVLVAGCVILFFIPVRGTRAAKNAKETIEDA